MFSSDIAREYDQVTESLESRAVFSPPPHPQNKVLEHCFFHIPKLKFFGERLSFTLERFLMVGCGFSSSGEKTRFFCKEKNHKREK